MRRSMLALGLIATMACLPLLGSGGAMLSPVAGTVAVNGRTISAGSAVNGGDTISTSASGTAKLALAGGTLVAASKTSFQLLASNQVRLNSGMLKITGNLPVVLNAGTVSATAKDARYTVTTVSGTAYITADSGPVTLKTATSTYTVKTGEAVKVNDQPQAPPAPPAPSTVPLWVGVGVAAGVSIVTGLVVHSASECNNCSQTTP